MTVAIDDTLTALKWYVFHTKSRHEKSAALRIESKGFESFLPVRSVMSKWKDRKKLIAFPLFPGYVFARIPLVKKCDVLQVPGIVRLVGQGRAEAVREDQIHALKTIVQEALAYDPYPYLVPGMEVEVIRGPLKHVRGVLEEKKSKHRLIINLAMINNCVATEIDAEDVRPL